ncbi:TssQ family T6SS-associated lipoprotein [Pseudomonas sp. SCB32]|uniref:TssQ family T6SS-associated lipoprotein n=1 Tax=Pseudomonas sp. SCB32 TaxID=2653853 RepID=UPI0012640B5A|nr:TssQ family T6SS-associated lipoprotein [Pseudomonas sp. SCB32]
MKTNRLWPTSLLIACMAATSGCKNRIEAPPAPAPNETQVRAENTFNEGMRLYEGGHYYLAEAQFLSPDIWAVDTEVQLKALKYLAFSYCVTERPIQCRFAFERALQIDPSFHLESAESGHPLWGPVFTLAASY